MKLTPKDIIITTYNLELTRTELEQLYAIIGSIAGKGELRAFANILYDQCNNILKYDYNKCFELIEKYKIIQNLKIG